MGFLLDRGTVRMSDDILFRVLLSGLALVVGLRIADLFIAHAREASPEFYVALGVVIGATAGVLACV